MTEIYFVRHAESDHTVHDDFSRPLTPKGLLGRKLVTRYLSDKNISRAFSSPYKRAVDTIMDFAERAGIGIKAVPDFREREIGAWVEDFRDYAEKQWNDFDYKLPGGESLREVQERNIRTLGAVLEGYPNRSIVIGTHGTALCTVIHYYKPDFGLADFIGMVKLTPWIVRLSFDRNQCVKIEKINLFQDIN